MSESAQEKPGRYPRTTGGLVGSMIVLVLAVLGIVVFREAFRDTPEIEPEAVDYLPVVASLQDAGREIAYPATLPDGWIVTSVTYDRGERPGWALGILTDDESFVGLRQQDEDVDDLVAEHVDEAATESDPVEIAGSLAPEWSSYADDGGDHGYAAEITTDLGEENVLVYGSASVADIEELVGLLTVDPLS